MAPVTDETARAAREADDATRGSAVKLAAEVASRLLGLGTTLLLARALGVSGLRGARPALVRRAAAGRAGRVRASGDRDAGAGGGHLLAEGPRPGARRHVRPRWPGPRSCPARVSAGPGWVRGAVPVLVPLVLFFVLAGWGEFLGVALRCRGARVEEALLLLVLRGGSLAGAGVALLGGAGLDGIAWSPGDLARFRRWRWAPGCSRAGRRRCTEPTPESAPCCGRPCPWPRTAGCRC